MKRVLGQRTRTQGFTLIELMVTVAIIGILAAIALPSYKQYVVRGNRTAAQAMLMELSNRNQQYFLANRAFATTTADLSYTVPIEVSRNYSDPTITTGQFLDLSCAPTADTGTAPSFVIALAPIASKPQSSDGTLYLSNTGIKCPAAKW